MVSHISAPAVEVRTALDRIRRIVQVLRSSSSDAERRVGLSGAQLFVLQSLVATEPLSLNALAARTFTHQSSVSVVVRRLVERGLVVSTVSAEDRRRLELSLSRRGRALLRRAPGVVHGRLVMAVERLASAERRRLIRALGLLLESMALSDRPPPMFFEDRAGEGAAR